VRDFGLEGFLYLAILFVPALLWNFRLRKRSFTKAS